MKLAADIAKKTNPTEAVFNFLIFVSKNKKYLRGQSKYYPHGLIFVVGKYYPENRVNITLRFFCEVFMLSSGF